MRVSDAADRALVERSAEVGAIDAALSGAARGAGGIVLVEGPAGIGKSRLLDEATAGRRALRARGSELEGEFPFGVVSRLLRGHVLGLPPTERDAAFDGGASFARGLLEGTSRPAPGTEDELFPTLHGLFWLVSNLAERSPLVLCVDDAHLSDAPSLRFVHYLAHRINDLPVAVLAAARPGGAGPGAPALAAIRSHPATRLLVPAPLSLAGVERLMAAHGIADPAPVLVRACAEASGGNPLYLHELLAVLAEEGGDPAPDRVREIGPRAVAHAVALGLSRLPPAATAVARAAAVLADDAPLRDAARLAGIAETTADAVAADLIAAGILRPGRELAFAHPVIRAALYESMDEAERAAAHRGAARMAAAEGAPAVRIAAHLLASDTVGEPWALDALRAAGTSALSTGDPAAAVRLLARALDEPQEPASRAGLLVDLGRAERATGGGGARFEEALDLTPDRRRRAEILLLMGRTAFHVGASAEAGRAFARGLAEDDGSDPALSSELRSGQAMAGLWDPERGVEALTAAGRFTDETMRPATVGERVALAQIAGALGLIGQDRPRTLELALRAWGDGAMLDQTGPEEPALYAVTGAVMMCDELSQAMALFDRIAQEAQRRALIHSLATAVYGRGYVHLLRGLLGEAMADEQFAIDAQAYGWGLFAPGAYWTLAHAQIERGDLDGASRTLELEPDREALFRSSGPFFGIHAARGAVALARGEPEAALAEYQAAGEIHGALGTGSPAFFPWRPGAATALVRLGRTDEAASLAEEHLAAARRWGSPRTLAEALRVRASTEPAEAGIRRLQEAEALLAGNPARLEYLRVLVDLGASLRRSARRDGAADVLRRALDLADRCGATVLARTARDELVAAGGRPRRARLTGAAALTPAELRVARMAAAGRTNRQIAEELFVTLKAVKFHLGNAYRKLGIESRDALEAALDEPEGSVP